VTVVLDEIDDIAQDRTRPGDRSQLFEDPAWPIDHAR
jgi:hypothetical protein